MKKEKKRGAISQILDFAGKRKGLTVLGCILSGVSMLLSMVPYICIWLIIRELVQVAPDWQEAKHITTYGLAAFAFAIAGIVVYFTALMCTHMAAFRTASNMRKQCMEHLTRVPLGYFDTHASGYLRRRIDGAAAQTETLLAHNLPDVAGAIVMFVATVGLLLTFDWRMGLACLMAVVISILCMMSMMGGKECNVHAKISGSP
ncbi:ATP-binding cassette, subfamily B [Lachnospiraceae bacterium XBB1006]|nr:ATP-binding cassette, subfamily B [Lachnospiraceae bacterium XBB1006]